MSGSCFQCDPIKRRKRFIKTKIIFRVVDTQLTKVFELVIHFFVEITNALFFLVDTIYALTFIVRRYHDLLHCHTSKVLGSRMYHDNAWYRFDPRSAMANDLSSLHALPSTRFKRRISKLRKLERVAYSYLPRNFLLELDQPRRSSQSINQAAFY